MVNIKSQKWRNLAKEMFAWLLALIVIIPFVIVIFNAFKTQNESFNVSIIPPTELHWENFKKVWEVGNILRSYGNSFFLSTVAVILSTMFSSMCSFVIQRHQTRVNRAIYIFFSLGLMFPLSMVTVVKVMRVLNLYNSRWGVAILFATLLLPLSIFLFYGFLKSIPRELDEAAIVDGAGAFRIFYQIIFPTLKPVTFTVVMINFLSAWNDFTIPLYLLPDPDKGVILLQIYSFFGQFTASWNLVMVAILYAIAPVMLLYIFGQRYIISGMVAGSVKG